MTDKAFILCVDDEPINVTIMEEILAEQYQIECVSSGQACLELIEQRRPDLVLLDVNMPDMDGLETCEILRNSAATSDVPVIFVSALATETELLAGYQAGGDDYITKPFSEDILQRKIEIVLEAESRKRKLLEVADNTVQAFVRNQSSMGELDMVVNFLHDCFKQTEFHGLSKVVFNCLGRLQLDSSLIFIVDPEPLYWFSDDIDRPMERQILLNLNSQDRIVKFGMRMAINGTRSTILIRNMPDQTEKMEKLTEYLTIIIEGLDAKINSMAIEDGLRRHHQALDSSINQANTLFEGIKLADRKQRKKGDKIRSKLSNDIEQLTKKKDLNATQNKALQQIVKRFEDQSDTLNDERQLMFYQVETLISDIIGSLPGKK